MPSGKRDKGLEKTLQEQKEVLLDVQASQTRTCNPLESKRAATTEGI